MHSFPRDERTALVLVLSLLGALAPGCDRLFGLDEVSVDEDEPNAYLCDCTCFAGDNDELHRSFDVCVPPALNPNLEGGTTPSSSALAGDCNGRVRETLVGILRQCGSNSMRNRLDEPGACACAPAFVPTFVSACNGECQSTPLRTDCANEETATRVGTLPPVCMAEPAGSPRVAMGRALFGDRSLCEVSGSLSVVRGDSDPVSSSASGVVEIEGAPCPGASCAVSAVYRLDQGGSLDFDSYAGFASVEFRDMRVSGASLIPATLDGAGNGAFDASALATSGRGTREDEEVFGVISDTTTRSYTASNVDPVDVGVDWAGHQCALVGALLAAEIEGEDTDIVLDVGGTLVNQPPRAIATGPRSFECTSPAGATITLTDGSTDPDGAGDIRFRDWWVGHPGGVPIPYPTTGSSVGVAQALGDTAYVLSVTDSRMAVSRAAFDVSVVDTTGPVIGALSASPARLFPLDHRMVPVTIAASSSDLCGGATSCEITSITSSQPENDLGDGDTAPDWRITGPLTAELRAESSAVRRNRVYTITVQCSDAAGNEGASRTVAVTVPANR